MKKLLIVLIVSLILFVILVAQNEGNIEAEKVAIKKIIQDAYVDGISNKGNVEAIKKGFHPDFAILGLRNNNLWKFPISSWIEHVERQKKEGKYPPKELVSFEYPLIDIVGNAAIAKIKYYRGEKHIYTDYLSLYKFNEGWKIVSKIYFEHK